MRVTRSLSVLGLIVPLLSFAPARAATFTYPGPAPCNTTLQDCIEDVPNRSTIEIAKDRVNEKITIKKSITLRGAPGFDARIGGPNNRNFIIKAPEGKRIHVALIRIETKNTSIQVDLSNGSGHSITVLDSFLRSRSGEQSSALSIFSEGRTDVLIQQNTIRGNGTAVSVGIGGDPGTSTIGIRRNEISSLENANSSEGIGAFGNGPGRMNFDISSNVVHNVGGCTCGNPSGIFMSSADDSEAYFNVTNNTIYDTYLSGMWMSTRTDIGDPVTSYKAFNNIISTGTGTAAFFPSDHPDTHVVHGYNVFHNYTSPTSYGSWGSGPGDTTTDPLFVDPSNGDFNLAPGSPARNSGRFHIPASITLTDLVGNARVSEALIDRGALESESRPGCSIIGTSGDDVLNGTQKGEVICGDEGEDSIFGRDGADVLKGGPGPDRLNSRDGVRGNDRNNGGSGDDRCIRDRRDKNKNC